MAFVIGRLISMLDFFRLMVFKSGFNSDGFYTLWFRKFMNSNYNSNYNSDEYHGGVQVLSTA